MRSPDSHSFDKVLSADPVLGAVLAGAEGAGLPLDGVYLVGGYVRDLLLGLPHFDIDIVVEGDGVALAQRLAEILDGQAIAHAGFGTAAVVATIEGRASRLDVATSRRERYEAPGALPTVEPAPLSDDLRRRDFTINALAVALFPARRGELIDPFGGVADIEAGTVRTLHDRSFIDDPTRMLRAVRYAARYGFGLDDATSQQMRRALEDAALATVSAARRRDDLELLLEEPAADSVAMLGATGLGAALHPELDCGAESVDMVRVIDVGMIRPDHPTAQEVEARQVLAWRMRLAVLMRQMSAEIAKSWLSGLRVQRRDIAAILDNLTAVRAVTTGALETASHGDRELHELFDPLTPEAHELAELLAQEPEVRAALKRFHEHLAPLSLHVDGHYLLSLGLSRGPAIGEVLTELYDLKLEGKLRTEQEEHAAAARIVQARLAQG